MEFHEKEAARLRAQLERVDAQTVTVELVDGDAVQQSIQADEVVALLKLRIYNQHEGSLTTAVAPPSVSRLTLGGIELPNEDTFADHDVQAKPPQFPTHSRAC